MEDARPRFVAAALALLSACLLATCGAPHAPSRDEIIDSRDNYDPRSLDPALSTDVPTGRAVGYLFDGLTRFTPDARVEPALDRMGIHHVDLVVSSIERSLPFYRELLGPLGWHGISEVEGERGETIWYLSGRDTSIGLREAQSDESEYDRYSVGLHHVAIEVASRAAVDERADWLRANGALLESEPQEYTYMPGYYAVFFYDPDGMKLEILHVPALAA